MSNIYSLPGVEFYLRALRRLHKVDVIIIVSDDTEWCKEHFAPELMPGVKVVYSPFSDEHLDFVLLFLGKHSIIANSSFSWWSAYLKILLKSREEIGQVIAPRPWYHPLGHLSKLNTDTFYPHNWQVLDL